MIVALAVLIVGGVLIVSAAVVLLCVASETEVLPGLRPGGGSSDEAPHSPRSEPARPASRSPRTLELESR
jgi:hypothetical protein